jgi:molybdopterin-binding protein
MISPEEITISRAHSVSSSRNQFPGKIVDIARARLGCEIAVDIGIEMVAKVSADALQSLGLAVGQEVWLSFKASSCRIYQ